jgi:hypothetical protein
MIHSRAFAFLTLAGVGVLIGPAACGSPIPTCATICTVEAAPNDCTAECGATQTACESKGASAYFQEYLTCVGNAGKWDSIDAECIPIAKKVTSVCGVNPDQGGASGGGSDAGSSGADTGAGDCTNPTCNSVCNTAGGDAVCLESCTEAQDQCPSASALFQDLLVCACQAGGWPNEEPACMSEQEAYNAAPCAEPGGVEH